MAGGAGTRSGYRRDAAVIAALAGIYFLAGRLGLSLASVNPSASAVWPPSGIALAALLVFGYRVWPGVALGAFLVNLTTSGSVPASIGITAGNTLEALLGAWLVNRFASGRHAFDRVRDFFAFLVLAMLSAMVSPTVGATSLALAGRASWSDFAPIWVTWWLGDTKGMLVATPLFVLASASTPIRWRTGRVLEAAALLGSLLLVAQVVYGGVFFENKGYPLQFACIPFLLWAAMRFGRRLVAVALAELTAIAVRGTARGFGPLAMGTQNEALLLLQAFIGVAAATTMALAIAVRERRKAGDELQAAHDELERRVQERTLALSGSNAALAAEVEERRRAEERLRASEEEYRLLFDSNPHPMWVYDFTTLEFLAVNDAAVRRYRYSREEFLAMTIRAIRAPEDVPELERALRERTHQALDTPGVFRHRGKDGQLILADIASRAIHFLGREARLVLAADVTERRNLEEQLLQSQKMETVGRLAGGVAHDFNNLLGVITGYGELLKKRVEEPRLRKYVDDILGAAERGSALTRQLLAFSRKQVLQPKSLDLNVVVGDMGGLLRRVIGEDIQLVTAFDDALWKVKADPGQIGQVVMNLAANARDAMPRGGRLTIATANVTLDDAYARLHPGVSPGAYAMVSVSDNGQGMTREVQARAFEPFFTTRTTGQGTGLGLATVHGIVKQSGGHIWLYSEPGQGTTFKIHLPREDAPAEKETPAAAAAPPPRGSETVLLVEDEDSLREIVRECLEDAGYTVLDAGSGARALEASASHSGPLHLVITDVVMPGMGGREVVERLQAARPQVRALYMSGYTDDAMVLHGVMVADMAFLQKPFSAAALAAKVRQVLDAPP